MSAHRFTKGQGILKPSAIALAVTSASFALADEPNDLSSTTLDTLTVSSETYRNTATKNQLDNQVTPQSISVISGEALDQQGADSLSEAVRYTSGINTELRGGAVTRLDLFNIRGFINYQNYFDGLQLLYNDWNLQPQIDGAAIEQVEVFKGPTSALYGYMPPGGMVNIISKAPQDDPEHSVELTVGSDNKREAEFDSTGAINEQLNYRVVGAIRQQDAQAVTAEEERIMIAPSLDWQASDDTLVNVNFYYQQDPKMGIYTSLPAKGTVLSNINGPLSSDAYSGDANWNTYDKEVALLGFKVDHKINDQWHFLQNTRIMDATAYQENTYSTGLAADERTLSRRAYLTDEHSKGITLDNQFAAELQQGEATHHLLLGLDYSKLKSDIRYEDAATSSIDLYNPDHYQISRASLDFAASGYSSDFTIEKEQVGVYLQDQIEWGNWVFLGGLRHDRFESSEQGIKYGANQDTQLSQRFTSGRAGVLYQFDNGVAPYVNYAQSYEPVSGSDRQGNTFDPSEGEQIEVGMKFSGRDTVATLAGYQIVKTKVKTRDPDGTAYDLIQVGEVRSRGIEADVTHYLNDEWDMRLALTVQDSEVTKDNSGLQGKTPIWVPDRQASVWLNYQPIDGALAGFDVGLGARYVGQMQIDAQNSGEVPSVTLFDASVGYDLASLSPSLDGASVRFSVSNLTDETYYSCYDSDNCWFGAERSLELSARYQF